MPGRVFHGEELLPHYRHVGGIQFLLGCQRRDLCHHLPAMGAKAEQHHHLTVPLPGRAVVGHLVTRKPLPPYKAQAGKHPLHRDLPLIQLGQYFFGAIPHPVQQDGLFCFFQFLPHGAPPLPFLQPAGLGGPARVSARRAGPLPSAGLYHPIVPHRCRGGNAAVHKKFAIQFI